MALLVEWPSFGKKAAERSLRGLSWPPEPRKRENRSPHNRRPGRALQARCLAGFLFEERLQPRLGGIRTGSATEPIDMEHGLARALDAARARASPTEMQQAARVPKEGPHKSASRSTDVTPQLIVTKLPCVRSLPAGGSTVTIRPPIDPKARTFH